MINFQMKVNRENKEEILIDRLNNKLRTSELDFNE
jgi:hypothetical protein